MKRLGVAAIIRSGGRHSLHLLMGRRGKDPNRGLYVLPGGGVNDGESLEEALCREVMEETGLEIKPEPTRWSYQVDIIELPDRVILVAEASVKCKWQPQHGDHAEGYYDDTPKDGSDLYEVAWFGMRELPSDTSPVVIPTLTKWGFRLK